MLVELDAVEARALGCLYEKSLTTPELYPLTYNALLNACNQKSSREPVMSLDENALGRAMQALLDKNLAERVIDSGGRVPKFRHRIDQLLGSEDPKLAGLIAVLLLRGAQTPGELKTRTERLCQFVGTAEVEAMLQDLSARPEPLVARLPRQSGQKETRYLELFSGKASAAPAVAVTAPASAPTKAPEADRLAALEQRVAALEAALAALKS